RYPRFPDVRRSTMPRPNYNHLLVGWVLLAASAGCGNGRLTTYPVSGQVLYNGQSLKGVDVAFHPADPKNDVGYPPHATTDAEGKFTLMTYVKDDGAPAGEFQVAVAFPIEKAGDDGSDQSRRLAFQVPSKYQRKETSGISVSVKSGTNRLEPFRLE